jgi:hypothetical protein
VRWHSWLLDDSKTQHPATFSFARWLACLWKMRNGVEVWSGAEFPVRLSAATASGNGVNSRPIVLLNQRPQARLRRPRWRHHQLAESCRR